MPLLIAKGVMMIITDGLKSFFNAYLGDYNDDSNIIALKTSLLINAASIVEKFLGYPLVINFELASYKKITFINKVSSFIALPFYVENIQSIKVNNETVAYYNVNNMIAKPYNGSAKNYRDASVEIVGEIGFANEYPDPINIAIVKIAALMYMETNKRIGVTGTTLPDGMSHTFVQYTNYSKHLQACSMYKSLGQYDCLDVDANEKLVKEMKDAKD